MPHKKVNIKISTKGKQKIYQLDYRLPGGKRVRETVNNKQDAELLKAEIEKKLILHSKGIESFENRIIDLKTVFNEYLEKKTNLRDHTVNRYEDYKKRIVLFFETQFPFAYSNIRHLQSRYVRELIRLLLSGDEKFGWKPWKKKTINDLIVVLKSVFKYASEKGYLQQNVMKEIELFKIPPKAELDYFDEEAMQKLMAHADPHWAPIYRFMTLTGLRRGELISLRWEDLRLDSQNPRIIVASRDGFDTKTGGARIIPLNKSALAIIESLRVKNGEYVFLNKDGAKIPPNTILGSIKIALRKAGLKGTIKTLRHTFASKLAMKGVSLYTIAELLGHQDPDTTLIYAHLTPKHLQNEIGKLDESALIADPLDDVRAKSLE